MGFVATCSTQYSMHLMMDYNEQKYIKFLKFIHRLRLHKICCCCCKDMVQQQLKELDDNAPDNKRQNTITKTEITKTNVACFVNQRCIIFILLCCLILISKFYIVL